MIFNVNGTDYKKFNSTANRIRSGVWKAYVAVSLIGSWYSCCNMLAAGATCNYPTDVVDYFELRREARHDQSMGIPYYEGYEYVCKYGYHGVLNTVARLECYSVSNQ